MLIPSKFNGYVQNVRLYNAMGGVGEAALIGAAIGGGSAAITGGDPLKGALLGGLTGGAGAGMSGALAGAAPAAEGLAAGAGGASATGAAIGTGAPTIANAQGIASLSSGAPTMANAAAANTAASTAANASGSLGSGTFGMNTPMAGVQSYQSAIPQAAAPISYTPPPAAATPELTSFQKAMQDPGGYISNNKMAMVGAGLAGATGAQRNLVPGEKEYNGPLKRFNPFDPNKYQASRYAEGGITNLASGGYDQQVGEDPYPYPQSMASGGIANLGSYSDGGRMLKGPGDGMSDSIPANISGKRPARLADGEFVVPADVVSHLGNGSTDAGAKTLYSMMDKVRTARTGRKAQGKQIDPRKYMAA